MRPDNNHRELNRAEPLRTAGSLRCMRMRGLVLCAVTACAVAAVAGCGTRSGESSGRPRPRLSTAAPATSRPASSQPGHRHTLTVADNGAKVRLRLGQKIVVILASHTQMWQPPRASGLAVRQSSSRGGYPASQVALASFVAVQPGLATLTSTTDAQCLHAEPPCEIAQQVWAVTIVVTKH
jgi:hypothetical protein